jgi:hypothetical protein
MPGPRLTVIQQEISGSTTQARHSSGAGYLNICRQESGRAKLTVSLLRGGGAGDRSAMRPQPPCLKYPLQLTGHARDLLMQGDIVVVVAAHTSRSPRTNPRLKTPRHTPLQWPGSCAHEPNNPPCQFCLAFRVVAKPALCLFDTDIGGGGAAKP